ncbi:MAG: hypothetical protein GY826_24960, partial [Fuerstiella sp.]|nr:hypothetical protein [Fuerstiella sp.]
MQSNQIRQDAKPDAVREETSLPISSASRWLHGTVIRHTQSRWACRSVREIGNQLYKVVKIVDGDTIDVLTEDKKTIRLRFNGIDTPERGQPFGNNATKFVSSTVGGKMVRLVMHGEDKYDRTIADIYLPVDDSEDMFLNR